MEYLDPTNATQFTKRIYKDSIGPIGLLIWFLVVRWYKGNTHFQPSEKEYRGGSKKIDTSVTCYLGPDLVIQSIKLILIFSLNIDFQFEIPYHAYTVNYMWNWPFLNILYNKTQLK